jgi:glycosyltransferase involved in cell wall biosynthesis
MTAVKIVLLSGEYPPQPGGLGDYTRRLGEALAARGHALYVATIHDERFVVYGLGDDPNRQSSVVNRQSNWGWSSYRRVLAALGNLRPDVLHIQYQTGAYAMRPAVNLLPWRVKRMRARPRVAVTFHDLLEPYLFPKAGSVRRWVTLRLARDADILICTNDADAAALAARGLSPEVIPIGSNIAQSPPAGYERAAWRARLGVVVGEPLVAFFGLVSRSKGLDTLLDALFGPHAHPALARARLLLIGGEATAPQDRAYAAEAEAQIARLGAAPRVIRTGHADEPAVSAHLLAADCVALPFRDGASVRRGSLLAALAHGCAVVTTRPADGWGALQEAALLTPPGDATALGAAIGRALGDASLRERLGAAARALAAQFGWDEIARRHEQLYDR